MVPDVPSGGECAGLVWARDGARWVPLRVDLIKMTGAVTQAHWDAVAAFLKLVSANPVVLANLAPRRQSLPAAAPAQRPAADADKGRRGSAPEPYARRRRLSSTDAWTHLSLPRRRTSATQTDEGTSDPTPESTPNHTVISEATDVLEEDLPTAPTDAALVIRRKRRASATQTCPLLSQPAPPPPPPPPPPALPPQPPSQPPDKSKRKRRVSPVQTWSDEDPSWQRLVQRPVSQEKAIAESAAAAPCAEEGPWLHHEAAAARRAWIGSRLFHRGVDADDAPPAPAEPISGAEPAPTWRRLRQSLWATLRARRRSSGSHDSSASTSTSASTDLDDGDLDADAAVSKLGDEHA